MTDAPATPPLLAALRGTIEAARLSPSIRRAQEEEGFRREPYRDHLGHLTVGYGTLLEDGLSEPECLLLLAWRMGERIEELRKRAPFAARLPTAPREALHDMAYQLGVPRLLGFKKMLLALAAGEFDRAAEEALDSKWAREDTPARARRNAELIRRGYG